MENHLDAVVVVEALGLCDAVVFTSGRSAYRTAEELKAAGLYEVARGLVTRMKVATVEGEKGAVMVQNAFGVRPAVVTSTVEEFQLEDCRCAVVFHYGARDEELLALVRCRNLEFFPYRELPTGVEMVERALLADLVVFTSALAVQFVEVIQLDAGEAFLLYCTCPMVDKLVVLHREGEAIRLHLQETIRGGGPAADARLEDGLRTPTYGRRRLCAETRGEGLKPVGDGM